MKKIIKKLSFLDYFCVLFILLFFGLICFVNIFGRQFGSFDIYSDMMYAVNMSDSCSFFPKDWVFGNQFYFIATPNLAAIIHSIIKDAYLSLAIASITMTAVSLITFFWCFKPFVSIRSLFLGALSFIGGTIFCYSASENVNGLQLFFTQASFYSCYLIVILFSLGIWLRCLKKNKYNYIILIICGICNYCLGMQSLRELLVLNLPLLIVSLVFSIIRKKRTNKTNIVAALLLGLNIFGFATMKLLIKVFGIEQNTILSSVSNNLFENIRNTSHDFLSYSGLILSNSLISIVAFIFSILSTIAVIVATVHIIKSKTIDAISISVFFCFVSILGVFSAGVLLIKTRAVYFFVWHLLTSVSLIYLSEHCFHKKKVHLAFTVYIIFLEIVSIGLNFYPDVQNIIHYNYAYNDLVACLKQKKYVFSDWRVIDLGVVSSYTNCQTVIGTYDFTGNENKLINHIEYLYSKQWYNINNLNESFFVFSDDSWNYINNNTSDAYQKALKSSLELVNTIKVYHKNYYVYSPSKEIYTHLVNE